MSTWTLDVIGAVEDGATGCAPDRLAAAHDAVGALASALARNAALGQRRYTLTVDGSVLAILGTGRDHDGSDRDSLAGLLAEIRDAATRG